MRPIAARTVLADHLETVRDGDGGYTIGQVAEAIIADPQAHVDALVAAGVLNRYLRTAVAPYYVVVQPKPHVHDWKVLSKGRGFHMTVDLICNTGDCDERRTVPNRLPIEPPDEPPS